MGKKRQKFVTAILRDKRGFILAVGKNSYVKTHPLQAFFAERLGKCEAVFLHAEVAALVKCKDLKKAYSIEILREHKDGSFVRIAPCEICQSALDSVGIKVI